MEQERATGAAAGATAARASVRRSRGASTRRALVDAALAAFAAQGVEDTAVDEITASANVAKGTFYVHFNRKQDVLLEWAAQLVDAIDVDRLPEDAPEALRALGTLVATTMAAGPRPVVGRMVREIIGNSSDWVRVLGERPTLWAIVLPIVERGQRSGAIRDDMSPLRLAMAITVLWLDNVVGWAERPSARPLPEAIGLATELFLTGAQGARRAPDAEAP